MITFLKLLLSILVFVFVGMLLFQKNTSQQISLEGERITLDVGNYIRAPGADSRTVSLDFINQSSHIMVVSGWRSSCGCMTILPNEAEVQSGDILDVSVTIDLKLGGVKTVWLQPVLQQSKDPSIVHLEYKVEAAGLIRVLDSVVMLDKNQKGILRMLCISPVLPTQKLSFRMCDGIEGVFSGWSERESSIKSLDTTGRIWYSELEITSSISVNAWIQIQTDFQSVGVYRVICTS